MRENRLRSIWQAGEAAVNGWLHLSTAYAAEVMAHQNWDSLTIDMQHGPVDYVDAVGMLQAISTTEVVPLARVPWNEPDVIMKCLDAGCYGLICPMINTRAEAEAFVGACRYPPAGYRSIGPNRALLYGGSDYVQKANETIITMAMIETAEALDNLDAILSVPGLDAIYVGPSDLSQSLFGHIQRDWTEPKMAEALERIVASAGEHGIFAGIHTGSAQQARQMIAKGYQLVTILSDARLLALAASQAVADVKQGEPDTETSTAGSSSAGPY